MAARKKPRKNPAKKDTKKKTKEESFYTKGPQSIAKHSLPDDCVITHGSDATPDLRAGHNRFDYEYHRPEDKLPSDHDEIIAACQGIYRKVGMVRNIIDLMSDFASEGLDLRHPVKKHERFFKKWAEKVNLQDRAHTFMKLLLRDANVVVRRKMAKISKPAAKEMSRAQEEPEKITTTKKSGNKGQVPWRYTFLSPTIIEKTGGEMGKFFGDNQLAMRIPTTLARAIQKKRKTPEEQAIMEKLPAEVIEAAQGKGNRLVSLSDDKMYVDYYKKDDWEEWATPFLFGILEDVMLKDKMKLADMAALDGVINVIRLWKLGNSDKQILPTRTAVNRLLDMLQHNVGGGAMDLVWDDMIDLKVEYPPVDKILGSEKYDSVNLDIIRGLGIPDLLIGAGEIGNGGSDAVFAQLKTLTERLEYVRLRCIVWLETELQMVAEAMGIKKTPEIVFGIMSLRDEAAEKQLLIQLLDRGIVSNERVLQVFGQNFAIELENMRREQKIRVAEDGVLEKANPYYRPKSVMDLQHQYNMELQGLKSEEGGGENLVGDQPREEETKEAGRPPGSRDTEPRDDRTEKVLSVYKAIAEEHISAIDKIFDQRYLKSKKVKNLRSLTREQRDELEYTKRAILATVRPSDKITSELIATRASKSPENLVKIFNKLFKQLVKEHAGVVGRQPNLKERRSLAASTWAMLVPKQ